MTEQPTDNPMLAHTLLYVEWTGDDYELRVCFRTREEASAAQQWLVQAARDAHETKSELGEPVKSRSTLCPVCHGNTVIATWNGAQRAGTRICYRCEGRGELK